MWKYIITKQLLFGNESSLSKFTFLIEPNQLISGIPNINESQILMLIKTEYLPYQSSKSILRPYHLYQDVCINILHALSFELNQQVEVYLNKTIIFLEMSSPFQLKFTFKDILYSICLYSKIFYIYSLVSYSFLSNPHHQCLLCKYRKNHQTH